LLKAGGGTPRPFAGNGWVGFSRTYFYWQIARRTTVRGRGGAEKATNGEEELAFARRPHLRGMAADTHLALAPLPERFDATQELRGKVFNYATWWKTVKWWMTVWKKTEKSVYLS
jgi:hypothetical protein